MRLCQSIISGAVGLSHIDFATTNNSNNNDHDDQIIVQKRLKIFTRRCGSVVWTCGVPPSEYKYAKSGEKRSDNTQHS